MIRSLLLASLTIALPFGAPAAATTPTPGARLLEASAGSALAPAAAAETPVQPPPTSELPMPEEDAQALERWRTPVEALTERMIGSASKSVRFDWRRSPVAFALLGSELLERNNFGSTRFGLMARKTFGPFMGEVAVSHAYSWPTESSLKLALTPYRQAGRPNRFELDVNLAYPLAEGVVTALPSFVPPAELVFSVSAGLRYLFYPGAMKDVPFLDAAGSVLAPRLSGRELENLEAHRLPGMQIDSARYGLLAGMNLDLYFQPGAFISPRVMIAVPLLSPITGTSLGLWWELSLGLGWAL